MKRRRRNRSNSIQTETLETRALLSTITVNSLADNRVNDSKTTLREAVDQADDGDVIEFSIGGTVEMQLGRFIIDKSITIRGLGPANTILDANEQSKIFYSSAHLTLEDMTLRDGKASNDGGAVFMDEADLVADNVKFIGNSAKNGGAIANFKSAVTITNGNFVRNKATYNGGAVYFRGVDGQAVSNSTFENNSASYGGAIYSYSSDGGVVVSESEFRNNSAERWGGAGYRVRSVTASEFDGNTARYGGGALYSSAVYESLFTGNSANSGGAVQYGSVTNSTFANNRARSGGATYYSNVFNSTIVENHASFGGGSYGGRIHSSIIADNTDGSGLSDVRYTSTYSSLIGSNRASGMSATGNGTDSRGNIVGGTTPIDPGLLPLARYGQNLKFMPLSPGSPAIDAGSNPEFLTKDQNGAARLQGTAVDMGAVEGPVASVISISDPEVEEGSGDLVFRVTHTGEATMAFTVDVQTQNGSASNADYTPTTRTLSFSRVGPQTREVRVPVTNDNREEIAETVKLNVTAISDSTIYEAGSGTGTISNDDTPVGIVLLGDMLNMRGTEHADDFSVVQDGNTITAKLNDHTFVGSVNDIRLIQVLGKGGNDDITIKDVAIPGLLKGGAGNDEIIGGTEDDTLLGGAGNDVLFGYAGDDSLAGGNDKDTIRGHKGDDAIEGGDGNDLLAGDDGEDHMIAGRGDDSVSGGEGNDTLVGDEGDDTLDGLDGSDDLRGDGGKDLLRGGDGKDRLDGGDGEDRMSGGNGNDVLDGGDGDDSIGGGNGNDRLSGEDGDDTLRGDDGNDWMYGGSGDDLMNAGKGNDFAWGNRGADTLVGLDGNDMLDGSEGADLVKGGAGRDILIGGRGADNVLGGGGDDAIVGGYDRWSSWYVSRAIQRWTQSGETYTSRVTSVKVYLNPGSNLKDDGVKDKLNGGGGRDLFYPSGNNDDVFKKSSNETRFFI